jgi:pimeloyl-ACP methyl ester carboxylesterase
VEKDGLRIDLSRLSSNSKFVLDPSSGHNIHTENPKLVARSIQDVLAAISKGIPLAP